MAAGRAHVPHQLYAPHEIAHPLRGRLLTRVGLRYKRRKPEGRVGWRSMVSLIRTNVLTLLAIITSAGAMLVAGGLLCRMLVCP